MRPTGTLLIVTAASVLSLAGCTATSATDASPSPDGSVGPSTATSPIPDSFTPLTVTPMGVRPQPVPGTDGRYHLVYELRLTNAKLAPATLTRVEVLDAASPSRVLASYEGQALVDRLRTMAPRAADSAVIAPDTSRILFVELSFPTADAVPSGLAHRLDLLGASNPGATVGTPLDYTVAGPVVDRSPPTVLGPPLAGDGWVALNGCCNSDIVHRGSVQSVNGELYDAQRFAIDYMRINSAGEFVHGDPGVVGDYVDYGAQVLAVADGTVIQSLDRLSDQIPGKLPNPADITLETVDGNNVVLDLGDGRYAFYAHLQKDSVAVHVGQHVTKGTVLGLLGNSGNTSAPHLHFHLMDDRSVLGSEGIPYVLDGFDLAGQIPASFDGGTLTGDWGTGRLATPVATQQLFPMNRDIVNFPNGPES